MKKFLKPSSLSGVVLCSAGLTFIARTWLMILGEDDRGLLASGSLPDVLSWILVAVTMGLLIAGTWQIRGAVKYSHHPRKTLLSAVSMVIAAICFCISSIIDLASGADSVGLIGALLGFLAAAVLVLLAWGRFKDIQFNMVFHGLVCLYLMFHLVSHYRLWSSFPQLQSYGFELMAIVFVMLACYQRAAADAGHGSRRAYTFFTLAALFFCITAIPSCDNIAFFLGCAIWMYFTPCRLTPSSRRGA